MLAKEIQGFFLHRQGEAVSFLPHRTSVQLVHTDLNVQVIHAQLLHRVEACELWRRHHLNHSG